MSRRVNKKVWGVVFQQENITNMLDYISIDFPQPMAVFATEGQADRYRLKLVKIDPKFNRNYKVVTCVLSYVEPTPKKYAVSIRKSDSSN